MPAFTLSSQEDKLRKKILKIADELIEAEGWDPKLREQLTDELIAWGELLLDAVSAPSNPA